MRISWILTVTVAAFGIDFQSVGSFAEEPTSPLRIATKNANDEVKAAATGSTTTLTIRSPGGIGRTKLERTSASWPAKFVLRIHLAGLESFRASNGKLKLGVSVSSHTAPSRTRVWKDDRENSPLAPTDRYFIEVRALDSKGRPTTEAPQQGGSFELQLPAVFFEDNPDSINLEWIDFYRN